MELMIKILSFGFFLYAFFTSFIGSIFLATFVFPLHFLSRRLFRYIIDFFIAQWMHICVFFTRLFGTKLFLYTEEKDLNHPCLIIMNHKNELDWFNYFMVSCLFQNPSKLKIALKKSIRLIPGAGWACQLASFLFLHRDWYLDSSFLKNYITYFNSINYRFQLLFFCEGTNYCESTVEKSNIFAKKNGLTVFKHVLQPRITGFVNLIHLLRDSNSKGERPIDFIYDVTVAYRKEAYGYDDILKGNWTKEVHMHVERIDFTSLPLADEDLVNWLRKRWEHKDKSLDNFFKNGKFIGNPTLKKVPSLKNNIFPFIWFNLALVFVLFIPYHYKQFRIIYLTITLLWLFLSFARGLDRLIIGL